MGEAKLYGKSGGGLKIDGIIKDYYAYAGENISSGSFVEFVNGIASSTMETSSDTKVSSATYSGRTLSAIALDNNRVFVAHGYGTGNYLYGIVVTVNGTIITYGTDTQLIANSECSKIISAKLLSNGNVFIAHSYLNGSNYCLYGIVCKISGTTITKGGDTAISSVTNAINDVSVELLDGGNVFILHSAGSDYYLYGIICTISDTIITVGTDTAIVSDSNSGKTISTTLLPDGRIFIAHSRETRLYLYGIICTVSGTTITMGTDTKLSSTYSTGEIISAKLLSSGNVFITHSYTTSYYLYGIICTISGATITKGTDTAIYESEYAGYYGLDAILLKNGDIFVVFNDEENRRELYGTVVSINGTTIAVGTATQMVATLYAGYAISALLLPNDTIFVAHNWSSDYYRLYAQIFGIADNIPTNNVVIPIYETQVRNVTTNTFNGVSKTSGVGGDSTAHGDKVSVFVNPEHFNLIVNGDFSNGLDGWTTGNDSYSISFENNYLKAELITPATTTTEVDVAEIYLSSPIIQNHVYYGKFDYLGVSTNNNLKPSLCLHYSTINATTNIATTNECNVENWKSCSGLLASSYDGETAQLRMYTQRSSETLTAGMKMYFDNFALYDLTSMFGAGNEPTKEWCDKYL